MRQIESGHAGQRTDKTVDAFVFAIRGQVFAQALQFLIGDILAADGGILCRIAGPDLECIAPAQPDIQTATDIALFTGSEAGEFPHFGDGQ